MNKSLLFGMLSLVTVAHANVGDVSLASSQFEKAKIKLNINNQLDFDIQDARLKLNATNDWTVLPEIVRGNTQLTLDGDLNDIPALFQIVTPAGEVLNGSFNKTAADREINLDLTVGITKQPLYYSNETVVVEKIKLSANNKSLQPQDFAEMPFSYRNNSWSATCSSGLDIMPVITCEIFSSPRIAFIGTGGGGPNTGSVFGGSFGASADPDYLVQHARGGWSWVSALFYSHIEAPNGWFNGGGVGIGGGGGTRGYYIYR